MTYTKILLFGSTGMLGRYIYTYFYKLSTYQIINIEYRVNNENLNLLEQLLIENNIDDKTCIINCIGLIPQRKSSDIPEKNYYIINGLFPQLLWSICRKYNAKMIQPTTDCVFSGKKGKYIETDFHDETNNYGISKSLGEPNDCTVIRTSIIGKEILNKKSFLEWVISNKNNKINGWTNHLWNGITCLEYCKVIEKIIQHNLFWSGVRHICSPTSKSKYELAMYISNCFNLNIEICPVTSNEIVDKTLSSLYGNNINKFNIPELFLQINELKHIDLL